VARLGGENSFVSDSLFDPGVNIQLGTRYLKRLGKIFDHQVPLVAASYNAGPHRVESWVASFGGLDMDEFIEHIPFIETRNYTKKVVRHYMIYDQLYMGARQSLAWLTEPIKGHLDRKFTERESWDSL